MRKNSPYSHNRYIAIILILIWVLLLSENFSVAKESVFVYDSKNKRDPFISLIGKNVTLTDVELLASIADVRIEGVILEPNKPSSALINGQILREGEFLGGFKLTKVTKYYVIMKKDEKEHKLQFRSPEEDQE